MSNFLYGSSNVYRHYKSSLEKGLFGAQPLKLVQCTKKTVLDAHVSSLPSLDLMVTSVLGNFIVDACEGVPDAEVPHFANQQITAHVEAIQAASLTFPEANFIVVPPFYRSVPSWFGPHLPGMLTHLTAEIARTQSAHIACIQPFVVLPSMLEQDGIHLTVAAGDQFLRYIDAGLAGLFVPVGPPEGAQEAGLDNLSSLVAANSTRINDLSVASRNFERQVRLRQKNDDFIFARMKEESDAEINRAREDRVCVTGLAPPPSEASAYKDQKAHYVTSITRLVHIACAAMPIQPVVLDVYVNLRKTHGQHLIEVKFDSRANAFEFRREGVRLAKEKHSEFGELFFTNSVTQSTRVRIEILRILAAQMTTATELAFVQGFVSRPVLHYRIKPECRSTAPGLGRSYTFVDAVGRYGASLKASDLTSAYARAGNTFNGALSQYFVVLQDADQPQSVRAGTYRAPQRGRGQRRGGRVAVASTSGSRTAKRLGDPLIGSPAKKTEKKEKKKPKTDVKITEESDVMDVVD